MSAGRGRRPVWVLSLSVVLALMVAGCASSRPGTARRDVSAPARAEAEPVSAAEVARRSAVVAAAELLRRWDQQRAAAYADGEPRTLRRLYVPRSRPGRADVHLLHRYAARGLVVTGMRTQLLSLAVRRWTANRLVLRVRDRLVRAVARASRRGRLHRVLPADGVDRWRLVLVRPGERWVMQTVVRR